METRNPYRIALDEKSLLRFLSEHRQSLIRTAQGIVGNESDAEDAVQDISIHLVAHLHQYRPQYTVMQWVYGSLRNRCIDLIRARASRARRERDYIEAARHNASVLEGRGGKDDPETALLLRDELEAILKDAHLLHGVCREEWERFLAGDIPNELRHRTHQIRIRLRAMKARRDEEIAGV